MPNFDNTDRHPDATPATGIDSYNDEIVTRSAPRWAWDIIDNVNHPDTDFTDAMGAIILACELADDEPISRNDPRLQSDT